MLRPPARVFQVNGGSRGWTYMVSNRRGLLVVCGADSRRSRSSARQMAFAELASSASQVFAGSRVAGVGARSARLGEAQQVVVRQPTRLFASARGLGPLSPNIPWSGCARGEARVLGGLADTGSFLPPWSRRAMPQLHDRRSSPAVAAAAHALLARMAPWWWLQHPVKAMAKAPCSAATRW